MTKGVGFARALFLFGLTRPPIRPWEDAAILAHPDARLSERIYDSRTPGRLPMVSGVAPISHSKRIWSYPRYPGYSGKGVLLG